MLKNFRLVNTDGLKGLFIKGRLIPFDKIDDTMAEQLIGKTHVLERLPDNAPAPALTPQLALAAVEPTADVEEPTAAEAAVPTSSRRRANG